MLSQNYTTMAKTKKVTITLTEEQQEKARNRANKILKEPTLF